MDATTPGPVDPRFAGLDFDDALRLLGAIIDAEARGETPPETLADLTRPHRPAPVVLSTPGVVHLNGSAGGGHVAYATAALDGECADLAATGEGGRNGRLNEAAVKLGSLVAVGALDETTVRDRLRDAAAACGLDQDREGGGWRGIDATITSGLDYGMRHPRVIPDRPPANGFSVSAGPRNIVGVNNVSSDTSSLVPDEQRDEVDGDDVEDIAATWRPVNIAPVLDGTYQAPTPDVGARRDGVGLFYPGRMHSIISESEAGKTWLTLHICTQLFHQGRTVVYLDFEDDEGGIVGRLMRLEPDTALIAKHFRYLRPDRPLGDIGRAALTQLLADDDPALVVIDGVTEAMTVHGLDPLSNVDVAAFGRALPGWIARHGPAVVSLDHVTKSSEGRGRYGIGAVHKLNGINGAQYVLENRDPFGINRTGRTSMYLAKDRPGQIRRHALATKHPAGEWVGDFVMEASAVGFNDAAIHAPTERAETFKPTAIMARISTLLQADANDSATPGMSKNAIEGSIRGKAETIRTALEYLVKEGYVSQDRDARGYRFTHIKPFVDTPTSSLVLGSS